MSFFSLSGSFDKPVSNGTPGEMASVGLHDKLFFMLRAQLPGAFSAIDFGAGTGAWCRRLIDAGNEALGVHLAPEECTVECVRADLNWPFSERVGCLFEVVTCIEVLEHVENPRNVFREARKLLKPGGFFMISTPNASGLYSRFKFFLVGRFGMFDDGQYRSIGHITPLTHWQLEKMFEEAGFEVVAIDDHDATPAWPRTLGDLVKKAAFVFRPFMRGHVGTQHIIMLGRVPDPSAA